MLDGVALGDFYLKLVVCEAGVGGDALDGHDELVLVLGDFEGDGARVFGSAEVSVCAIDDLSGEDSQLVLKVLLVGQ